MNNFYFSTYLTTNFKPKYINDFSNINIFKKNKNQIFCRNLFLFLILIKYKNKKLVNNSTVFIKPYKKKIYTILRAPYRHKLARHQIVLNRYEIVSTIKIKSDSIFNTKNFNDILKLFVFFKNFNTWFESNVIYNYKTKTSYMFNYNYNFLIKNYKINVKK